MTNIEKMYWLTGKKVAPFWTSNECSAFLMFENNPSWQNLWLQIRDGKRKRIASKNLKKSTV